MNLHVLTEAWTEALPEAWDCNQSEARSGVLKKKRRRNETQIPDLKTPKGVLR